VGALDGAAAWLAAGGVDALHTSGLGSGVGSSLGVVDALAHGATAAASTAPGWLQHAPALVADAVEFLEETSPFDVAGQDLLIFLAATSAVVPACKALSVSPVLGFLGAGVLLGPEGAGQLGSGPFACVDPP
jgi:hypothetical protein